MNNRSTLASGSRSRSGHRYRDDDEPFAHADHPAPSDHGTRSGHRYAAAAPAAAGFEAAHDGGHYAEQAPHSGAENGWATDWSHTDSWAGGAAWSDGDAWNDGGAWQGEAGENAWQGENAWNADSAWNTDNAWTESDPNWTAAADDSWTPESNASWTPDTDGAWTPGQNGSWTSDTGSWTPDADGSWTTDAAKAGPTVIPARDGRRGGAHRMPAPPASLKGRAAVVAVAAGAVVAAGQAAFASPGQSASTTIDYEAAGQVHEIAAQSMSVADPALDSESPQVLTVSSPANLGQFDDMLQKGQKFAEDLAAQEAAKLRPLFTKFAAGTFTSGYGARWGVQHLGVDIAGPIGTPIYAVADGTVIESGPAAGFGMWVRLLHDDGTITIYGHIDTSTVSQGERVMAGDQIATIGNRGFSTGPHCHFEVWQNGTDKIDPLPWLASRGISLGPRGD
ncbi:peptidoglycan DD-metalloendopeptidase family protein [Nocardia takedensis]|uniref:M23 family metallopeptidase n=1 Tax=Nocardia takedensis TaxID=259390 RepID=UPI000306F9D1|nr:M23 family metallopeptidase [Nocardia takedensis]